MTQSLSRQQRKQMMREAVKSGMKLQLPQAPTNPQPAQNFVTEERLVTVIQDLQKILNYSRYIENRMWLLTETLVRKDLLKLSDISETESLYVKKEEIKKEKVKELLSQEKTVVEYLEAIKEDPNLLGYQKLGIHPVKDLNLNPFEVAHTLKELYPNLTQEKYLEIGKRWELTHENFGFKKPN